jgi:hypothetical protein
MSWADDIRCLYCDGRLPLYRKITNGQFCSTAHRKAYWQEQERLAVERLHQTHSSLRAYRPQGSVEDILGPEQPPFEEFQPPVIPGPYHPEPAPVAVQEAERPAWLIHSNAGEVPVANFVASAALPRPYWLPDILAGAEPEPFVRPNALRRPVNVYDFEDPRFATVFAEARSVRVLIAPRTSNLIAGEVQPVPVTGHPAYELADYQPVIIPFDTGVPVSGSEPAVEPDPAPLAFALLLTAPPARDCTFAIPQPLSLPFIAGPALGSLATNFIPPAAVVPNAGLRRLPVELAALVPGPWIDSLRALDVPVEGEAPEFARSTPPVRPRLRMAPGRRYPVATREITVPLPETAGFEAATPDISLPVRKVKILRAAIDRPSEPEQPARIEASEPKLPEPGLSKNNLAPNNPVPAAKPDFEPNPSGLLPIACVNKPTQTASGPIPSSTSLPQPLKTEPMRPSSRLEPMEPAPGETAVPPSVLSGDVPPAFVITPPPYAHAEQQAAEAARAHVWTYAIDFWNRAPRDLKLLVFAIPALLALALHPSLPKVRVAAPAGIQKNMENVFNTQWKSVKQVMGERAAVALDEDFRAGLDDWASRGDAPAEWSFDATGFVKPGPLAMYRPSLGLTDYQLQFLGLIDKQAMSWVVRAADFENFYVVKLVVLKGGPLPTIGVTRYSVVNGVADSRVDTVVPVDARTDMLYRVRMDVQGDNFTLLVQGQMVDSWSEPRLRHGGVGFFSARGEESRVRWVQVTHQYDMLGRLCAYLAPYNMPAGTQQ